MLLESVGYVQTLQYECYDDIDLTDWESSKQHCWSEYMKKIKPKMGTRKRSFDPRKTKCFVQHPGHVLISSQSERRMCCASREEHKFKNNT